MNEIECGFCQCGCGLKTNTIPFTAKVKTSDKGKPRRFIHGHNALSGDQSPWWKGGKCLHMKGYVWIYQPNHPRAYFNGHVLEHLLVAEKALGRLITSDHPVHHFPSIASFTHLVICENKAYHVELERRYLAFLSCGHAHWRKCNYCKKWDDPQNDMYVGHKHAHHRHCHAECERNRGRDKLYVSCS